MKHIKDNKWERVDPTSINSKIKWWEFLSEEEDRSVQIDIGKETFKIVKIDTTQGCCDVHSETS